MAKVNFTAGRVNGHSCPAGKSQAFLWNSDASGLGVRAAAVRALSYIFQRKLSGATVRVTIGSPKDCPLTRRATKYVRHAAERPADAEASGGRQDVEAVALGLCSPPAAEDRLAAPNRSLHRMCEIAGIALVTLHGLRRSFSSLAGWGESPAGIHGTQAVRHR